jgi:hypothetical protein
LSSRNGDSRRLTARCGPARARRRRRRRTTERRSGGRRWAVAPPQQARAARRSSKGVLQLVADAAREADHTERVRSPVDPGGQDSSAGPTGRSTSTGRKADPSVGRYVLSGGTPGITGNRAGVTGVGPGPSSVSPAGVCVISHRHRTAPASSKVPGEYRGSQRHFPGERAHRVLLRWPLPEGRPGRGVAAVPGARPGRHPGPRTV